MKKIKFVIPIALFILFLSVKWAMADAYVVHLYYDASSKTLNFDRTAQEKVSLDKNQSPSVIDFTQQAENSSGQFILTFYDSTNSEIISSQFDPQNGPFQLTIPYFSIASSLEIFDKATGVKLLDADITNLSTCNGNGICEYEKGETAQNCIQDCANGHPAFSQQTQALLDKNNGVVKDYAGQVLLEGPVSTATNSPSPASNGGGSLLTSILTIIGGLIFIVLIILGYKKYIRKN